MQDKTWCHTWFAIPKLSITDWYYLRDIWVTLIFPTHRLMCESHLHNSLNWYFMKYIIFEPYCTWHWEKVNVRCIARYLVDRNCGWNSITCSCSNHTWTKLLTILSIVYLCNTALVLFLTPLWSPSRHPIDIKLLMVYVIALCLPIYYLSPNESLSFCRRHFQLSGAYVCYHTVMC